MNRRTFLVRCAAASFLAYGGAASYADTLAPADLTIVPNGPGFTIPRDFLGLSYEATQIRHPDFLSPDNHSLLALIRRLGGEGVIESGETVVSFPYGDRTETTRPFQSGTSLPRRTFSGWRRSCARPAGS